MKKYFLTGLVTLLPLAVTLLLFYFFIDLLTRPFVGLIEDLLTHYKDYLGHLVNHRELLLWLSRFVALILLFLTIFLLGFLVRKLFLHYFVDLAHRIFQKIPLVRTIYKTTKQVAEIALADDQKFFKKSVLLNFPHDQTRAMGFQTSEAPESVKKALSDEDWHSVFIPTSPHPISGFLILASSRDVREIDVSTEDVFKFLVSCGVYRPNQDD